MYLECDVFEEKKEFNIVSSANPTDWNAGFNYEGGADIHNNFESSFMNADSREDLSNYEGGWGNDWNAGGYGAVISAP